MGIPDYLTFLLQNLHARQEATIGARHRIINWFKTGKRVHHSYILSPRLFNLYTEYNMWYAWLVETQAWIKTAERDIKSLRYADDITLIRDGKGTPLQYSCLENPRDGGTWWAAVHVVAKSWTRLSGFTFTFNFHSLKKEMATLSSVLAWRIPGTREPGGLPSTGSHRVGHDWSDLAAATAAAVTLRAESKEKLRNSYWKWKKRVKNWLKTQHS